MRSHPALGKSLSLAGLLWALAVAAAAGAAHGVMSANGSGHVATVEVLQRDPAAPAAFADTLRGAVLREAALYGDAGQPVALRIELDKVHLKNPVKAMLIGDNNMAKGRVAVVDPSTGQLLGTFAVKVDAERRGISGRALAMTVLGALDPTGYVDVAGAAANAASADINRSSTEAMMSANFATETLRQTFGDAKARAVHAVKR